MSNPKIFVFSNVVGGGDGPCFALAEDGTVVGSHYCSHEGWASHDLGVTSDWHHAEYKAHYPDGYEMEFVRSSEIDAHEGLQAALKRNHEQAKAEGDTA